MALRILRLALMLFLAVPTSAGSAMALEESDLVIVTDSDRHRFRVELAVTPDQQATGLMHRKRLAPDAGMLFAYGQPRRASMWMKNTLIPLDMLFIAADGRIESIAERTVPHSLATVNSRGKVRAVLELNGGTADRLGIRPGDRVVHRTFGNAGGNAQ